MRLQSPAEGVMKTHDWGDSKMYYIVCDCGDSDHAHTVEVEADEFGIHVHCYVKVRTKWWGKKRWRQIWQILTNGYAEMETTVVMQEQTAFNYAETLKSAVTDVKKIREDRKKK